jgi:peptide-N4-(N-acetyl-beta-glucosaminyl)asparagine amidase
MMETSQSRVGWTSTSLTSVDTYRTQDHANDPPTPHVSVHSPPNAHHRHSLACAKPHQLPHLTDGENHELVLLYDARNKQLRVNIDGSGLLEAAIPSGDDSDWYMGVTAACGGLYQLVSNFVDMSSSQAEIMKWSWEEITYKASSAPDV